MRRRAVTALVVLGVLAPACSTPDESSAATSPARTALIEDVDAWFDLYLDVAGHDQWVSPPRVSRDLSLIALAAHETIALGVDGLTPLGAGPEGWSGVEVISGEYDLPIALGAAIESVLEELWADDYHAAVHLEDAADLRRHEVEDARSLGIEAAVIDHSIDAGQRVGAAVVERARSDGYHSVRSQTVAMPENPGAWVRTGALRRPPMEPHWGALTPWVAGIVERCRAETPASYSEDPSSDFHAEAMATYSARMAIDDAGRDVVLHWADEPRRSVGVPGHWMLIARAVVHEHSIEVADATELYLRVALALADAAIVSWDAKYSTFVLRPETYIQRHIDPQFRPIVASPPFPAYTSGHAVFSIAASQVLTELAGPVGFTDRSGAPFGRPVRRFTSPAEAADEAVSSRVLGGIHYPMDEYGGVLQGQCVADAHAQTFSPAVPAR